MSHTQPQLSSRKFCSICLRNCPAAQEHGERRGMTVWEVATLYSGDATSIHVARDFGLICLESLPAAVDGIALIICTTFPKHMRSFSRVVYDSNKTTSCRNSDVVHVTYNDDRLRLYTSPLPRTSLPKTTHLRKVTFHMLHIHISSTRYMPSSATQKLSQNPGSGTS
jgi:hypothetical protein